MASVSARIADGIRHDDNRRIGHRTEINRTAVLRVAGEAYDIHVADLTREGCKITAAAELEIGDTVTLGFAGIGHTTATILWRDGHDFGCIFERHLPPGAVTAATLNNVDSLDNLTRVSSPVSPEDVKWSRGRQIALIAGVSALLWIVIIAGAMAIL